MKTKICSKCGIEKPVSEFHKASKTKDGYYQQCILCRNIYFKNHKGEKAKYDKKWRRQNAKRLLEKKKIYQKNRKLIDKKYHIFSNYRNRINMSLINGTKGFKTMFLIGCEIDYLMYHLQQQFKSGMSWDNYGRGGWEVDHIIPCASFDLSKSEEQIKCFNYKNLQPLWAEENIKKGCNE